MIVKTTKQVNRKLKDALDMKDGEIAIVADWGFRGAFIRRDGNKFYLEDCWAPQEVDYSSLRVVEINCNSLLNHKC